MLYPTSKRVLAICLAPFRNRNRNCKLEISTAPTKAKSREPAYSQALVQIKIDRKRVRYIESGRQAVRQSGRQAGRQSDGYGGWCLELRWEGGREKRLNH